MHRARYVMEAPIGAVSLLRRPQSWGGWFHFGVGLPDGRVVDLQKTAGLRIASFNVFADGKPVSVVRTLSAEQARAALHRVHKVLAAKRRYDPVTWNCESCARYAIEGNPRSNEVFFVLFTIGSLFVLTR